MKNVMYRLFRLFQAVGRVLALGALGTFALSGLIALRHMLQTPQALESPLPGESRLYHWKYGYIFYKVAGEPEAPPLLMLHSPGLAASAYEMRGIIEPLSQHFRVYAPDLLGFGLSDRPSTLYTPELYTQLCQDFLTEIVQKPALLLASQLACNYAVSVAATSPNSCNGLVLISPTTLQGQPALKTGLVPPALLETSLVRALLYPVLVLGTRLMTRFTATASLAPGDQDYFYATTHRFGAEHAVMTLLAGKLSGDVSLDVERLRQPMLVIWGADALGAAQGSVAQLSQPRDILVPARAHVELLPEGGLAVHEEAPQRVAEAVLQWSAAQRAATAPAEPIEAYCMKCKARRAMRHPREVTMKNGRLAVQGDCVVCGTSLFRMGRLAPGYPQTPI